MIKKINCNKIITKIKKLKNSRIVIYLGILLFIYLLLVLFAKKIETIATFPATSINVQDLVGYTYFDLKFEEINIDNGKGENINGIFVDAGTGSKVVYYFHGNGGPINYFYNEINYINKLGYSVMAYDYPGYGKSEGTPYKENVLNFSQIFYEVLKEEKNIKDNELILWGYSIGSAVAIDFASKNKFDKLILISPFASRYDMSKYIFGFEINKFLLLKNSFVSKELVKNINNPVLILHGNIDKIVPFFQSEIIFKNYKGDKNFIEIDNFGHNNIIDVYGKSLKGFFSDFLKGEKLNFSNNYFFLNKEIRKKIELETNKIDYINSLNLKKDSNISKFINSKVSFNDKKYIPENLVKIGSKYVFDAKGGRQILKKEANDNLQKLAKSFHENFNRKIKVISAYRSYSYQKGIKNRGCPDNLCAKAGYSEHQSGLAVDLWEATTKKTFLSKPHLKKYYNWLVENAHIYGFHNTYQKGLEIDGYDIEPWHWRYVGNELATYLKENNITIAEFYNRK